MNHEDTTMLALAALTYRGFGHHSEAVIARMLDPWLDELDAESLGRWRRVWGPACFRAPTSLVDDAMVYVAKQDPAPGGPPRYVVAIRGTNPISFFDWLFGDLWVRHRVAWTNGSDARLSASTALGLAILQNLTATEPPSSDAGLAPVANGLASALQGVVRELPELLPLDLLQRPASLSDTALLDRIGLLTGDAGSRLRQSVFGRLREHFDELARPVRTTLEAHVFELLLGHVSAARGRGETLLQFLDRVVEPRARLTVVGHSKGGALALAAALWLAEAWAPAKRAVVDCFAFAGPTPGDAAFAKRYDAALGSRTRCIVNRRDVVPQAWSVKTLGGVGSLYPPLSLAAGGLSASVEKLAYAHVGGTHVEFERPQTESRTMVDDLIHQHMNAYLEEAGLLGPKWNAITLFLDPGVADG